MSRLRTQRSVLDAQTRKGGNSIAEHSSDRAQSTPASSAVRHYYNAIFYTGFRLTSSPMCLLRAIGRIRTYQRPVNLLDVGCGRAWLGVATVKYGHKYCGVDISDVAISEAPDHLKPHLLCADIADLPLNEASFDTVVCIGTIEHLPNATDALRTFARTVRLGGDIIVSFPNPLSIPRLYERALGRSTGRSAVGGQPISNAIDWRTLVSEGQRVGLVLKCREGCDTLSTLAIALVGTLALPILLSLRLLGRRGSMAIVKRFVRGVLWPNAAAVLQRLTDESRPPSVKLDVILGRVAPWFGEYQYLIWERTR